MPCRPMADARPVYDRKDSGPMARPDPARKDGRAILDRTVQIASYSADDLAKRKSTFIKHLEVVNRSG
jgi:hypothetical protein